MASSSPLFPRARVLATMKSAARTTNGASSGALRWPVARAVVLLAVVALSLASLALASGGDPHLPSLLAELSDRGYMRHGGRAVFLGDDSAGPWLPFLERSHVAPVSAAQLHATPDESVDLAIICRGDGVELGLVDPALKVGGAAAFLAAPTSAPRLPENYNVVFARRSDNDDGAVAVAAEKASASTGAAAEVARPSHRKLLLAAPGRREDVLAGLEGVLLEPPQRRHAARRLRPRYLPELTGDSLEGYRRRVFIDITPAAGGGGGGGGGAASWFRRRYPRGRHEFEIVRLAAVAAAAEPGSAAAGVGDWLEGNVREEDCVVVKAGVEAAEEMLREREGVAAARRVDELFLECGGGGGGAGRWPYWRCLALYGRLRDQGVAVHQWWGGTLK